VDMTSKRRSLFWLLAMVTTQTTRESFLCYYSMWHVLLFTEFETTCVATGAWWNAFC
jgi:hypothetical protein